MHVTHPLGDHLLGFGPHQVDIALRPAKLERIGRIAAEVEQRAAVLLIGPRRICRQPRDLVDLAVVFDVIARPRLAQDLDQLVAAAIAEGAVGDFARKIRRDDIEREPPPEHVVERRDGAREHDGLQLAAADRS